MQKQLTCNQVNALLSFYVEDKLNEQLKKYIEYHLSICPECYEKYQKLKKLVNNFTEISKKINSEEDDDTDNPYITDSTKILNRICQPTLIMNSQMRKTCG